MPFKFYSTVMSPTFPSIVNMFLLDWFKFEVISASPRRFVITTFKSLLTRVMSTSPVVIVMVLSFLKVASLAEKSPMLNSKVVSEACLFSKSISPVVIEKAMFAKLLFSISASPEVMFTVPELRGLYWSMLVLQPEVWALRYPSESWLMSKSPELRLALTEVRSVSWGTEITIVCEFSIIPVLAMSIISLKLRKWMFAFPKWVRVPVCFTVRVSSLTS